MDNQVFVGREAELAELQGHLDRMLAGQGGSCYVVGQAGGGKTTLVRYFLKRAAAATKDLIVAVGSGNAQTGIGDPYLPFREALGMLTGDITANQATGKITSENAGRLRTVMVRSVQVLVEVAPELINVLVPGAKLLAMVGQQMVKKVGWLDQLDRLTRRSAMVGVAETTAEQVRIVEKYTAFLRRLSEDVPLVLFLDDLQWADAASINLLFHLARNIENRRILIIGAYRPSDVSLGRAGQRHPLEPVTLELTRYYGDVTVDLDQVPAEANRRFVDQLLDTEPNRLGVDFREALYRQTGGHPLFTVELLHAMRKRGDLVCGPDRVLVVGHNLDWTTLPAKVEGVIAERIARLDQGERALLTTAAVEGQEFTAEVVARVEALAEREAIRLMSNELERRHKLLESHGMTRIGSVRLSLFRFVHSLFQQYLYNYLSEAERVYLHRDIGAVLEELCAPNTEEVAARLAHHYELAGVPDKAAFYRLQAGNRARRMSAHHEALTHLRQGLRLLTYIPQSPDRDVLELNLQTALGTVMVATHGYAAFDVQAAFARARQLCTALDNPHATIPVIFGLGVHYLVCGELRHAYELGRQLLDLAHRVEDTGYILGARLVMGVADMYRGNLTSARRHLEQAIVEYEPDTHRDLAYAQGQDPAVAALGFLGLVLWTLGYPDQARRHVEESIALAERIDHPYSLAFSTSVAATLYMLLRDHQACFTQSEVARELSQDRFPLWQATSCMHIGWVMAQSGQVDAGMDVLTPGLALWEGSGALTSAPYFRTHMAEAQLLAGRIDEGRRILKDAWRFSDQGWWLAEQHRLFAEYLLTEPGNEIEAENALRWALELARQMEAQMLALRTSTSLARLLARLDRAAEGHALLLQQYRWFREGHNTPDLQDAAALLDELGGRDGAAHNPTACPDDIPLHWDVAVDATKDAHIDAARTLAR